MATSCPPYAIFAILLSSQPTTKAMNQLLALSQQCATKLLNKQLSIAIAESCTGGLVTYSLSTNAGISASLLGGFVTYSNELKHQILGVKKETLAAHGAVSGETVTEMLTGLKAITGADIVLATSGVAGPDGGTDEKPVGTVWLGCEMPGKMPYVQRHFYQGNRIEIQQQSAITLLTILSGL